MPELAPSSTVTQPSTVDSINSSSQAAGEAAAAIARTVT